MKPKLCPRLHNLAKSLTQKDCTSRELMDLIPSNNPPVYVQQLRKLGVVIDCQRVKVRNSTGEESVVGLYKIADASREYALSLIQE